jgi:hypothetical protein
LPETFAAALEEAQAEWSHNRAIDGLLHTRVHNTLTDALARQFVQRLLKDRLDRGLVIVEAGESSYEPDGPDVNSVVLLSRGEGEYQRYDVDAERARDAGAGTDSFYLAITRQLRPDERTLLGLESDGDVAGLRSAVATLAINEFGGWFESRSSTDLSNTLAPAWLKRLSDAERYKWSQAVQAYSRAVSDAQESGFPDLAAYGDMAQLRSYARGKLRERLLADHGLDLEPDEVIVETRKTLSVPRQLAKRPPVRVSRQSLTDLSVSNVTIAAKYAEASIRVIDGIGTPILGLTHGYLYDLVRELDVGEDYGRFLNSCLLTSAQGKWYARRYADVMQAQMRLDALEAKMAGDLESEAAPVAQQDRAYKWLTAVLDHPADDGSRALVEGHRIEVQNLRIDEVQLDGLLIIATASRLSVPSLLLYTPRSSDEKCFHLMDSFDDLRTFLLDSNNLEYLVGLAPLDRRATVRTLLLDPHGAAFRTVPYTGNFLEAAYKTRVNRVAAAIDEQTSSTWEHNLESATKILIFAGEVALGFTPFKIALPIAALRSIYAVVQGIRNAAEGEKTEAAGYFLEAAFLLLDMIPVAKGAGRPARIKPVATDLFINRHTGILNFDARPALPQVPDGLKMRTDGFYTGVSEKIQNGRSSFYLVRNGKAYPLEPDLNNHVWRMIDLRNPTASSKTPIFPDSQNVWRYHPPGGAGGGVFKLDLTGLEDSKIFRKQDAHIAERLRKSIATIETDFASDNGSHGFHPVGKAKSATDPKVSDKLFTFDIGGMPNDHGRGAWRLKVRERATNKGILVLEEIMPSHKSKK